MATHTAGRPPPALAGRDPAVRPATCIGTGKEIEEIEKGAADTGGSGQTGYNKRPTQTQPDNPQATWAGKCFGRFLPPAQTHPALQFPIPHAPIRWGPKRLRPAARTGGSRWTTRNAGTPPKQRHRPKPDPGIPWGDRSPIELFAKAIYNDLQC